MFRVCILIAALPILISGYITTYNLGFYNYSPFPTLLRRDYTAFRCWLSCAERAAIMCFYLGYKDTGNAVRPSSFTFDPAVDRSCQQLTTAAYSSGYDRYLCKARLFKMIYTFYIWYFNSNLIDILGSIDVYFRLNLKQNKKLFWGIFWYTKFIWRFSINYLISLTILE